VTGFVQECRKDNVADVYNKYSIYDLYPSYYSIGDCSVTEDFVKFIYNYPLSCVPEIVVENKELSIKECVIQDKGAISFNDLSTIYANRNFDNVISRHKKDLMSRLDAFIEINKPENKNKDHFGTYNLGIMLYGLKGTGKTTLLKAVCNYLRRPAVIVDMRLIKNRKDFQNVFSDKKILNSVIILEEFDFVQGVIRERLNGGNGNDEKESVRLHDTLKDRKIQLLQMLSGGTGGKESDSVKEELADVNTKISNCENALTLDTMLTVLDGLAEVRNRCIIATTNYIDRIDSALIREGRFDVKLELKQFNGDETRELLTKIFKVTDEESLMLKNTKFQDGVYTPAQIINICQINRLHKCVDIFKV
jgi:SpoVK/Ycf46/Vps4 family AAA+-type ATPase